ncbi:MAG: T9SS type A sorting domain-containing protein [Bacteroidales bacterium]
MRIPTSIWLSLFFLLNVNSLYSQSEYIPNPQFSLSPNRSVLFGTDIVILDQAQKNQTNTDICYAFNGWIFSAFIFNATNTQEVKIMKSVDNGLTWSLFYNKAVFPPGYVVTKIDIVSTGDSLSNLKIVLACIYHDTLVYGVTAFAAVHNGITGAWERNLLVIQSADFTPRDIALASDALSPANNLHPGSVGILYSRHAYNKDSVIFLASVDGGLSIASRKVVTVTDNYVLKVSLSYGSGATLNGGRYYAAWSGMPGHIYTAHTEPGITSPMTAPKNLDSLQSLWTNQCRNPVIACQFGNMNNNAGNITEVVLFEKFNPLTNDYDIAGCYNPQSSTSSNYQPFEVAATTNNEVQPDVVFNPFDSTFILTYFDETAKKLPFLTNDFNLQNPDIWSIIHPGYNDNSDLVSPFPKVSLNTGLKQGVLAWTGRRTGGNGVALFDAVYNYYTSIRNNRLAADYFSFSISPNPCQYNTCIGFDLPKEEKISISIYNLQGIEVFDSGEKYFQSGHYIEEINLSKLIPGYYIVNFRAGTCSGSAKLIVIH